MGGTPCAATSRKSTLVGTGLRILFFATFVPIAYNANPEFLFGADWFKILNVFIFGMSNGFLSTRCAILAPSFAPIALREETGVMVGAVISIGITTGSVLAIPMAKLTSIGN